MPPRRESNKCDFCLKEHRGGGVLLLSFCDILLVRYAFVSKYNIDFFRVIRRQFFEFFGMARVGRKKFAVRAFDLPELRKKNSLA